MAGTNIGVYEFGSMVRGQHVFKSEWLTKRICTLCGKPINMKNTLQMIDCSDLQKQDAHIKRDIKNMIIS